jgi:hypothetical protein
MGQNAMGQNQQVNVQVPTQTGQALNNGIKYNIPQENNNQPKTVQIKNTLPQRGGNNVSDDFFF